MYKLKKGSHYRGLTAEVIAQSLEQIRLNSGGQLTPEEIVEVARDENHPLHPAFTWDDTEAAEAHRRHEARTLIKIVVVTKNDHDVPAFVNVVVTSEDESSQYYQSVEVLTKSEYESALEQANRKLKESVRSLEQLKAIAPTKNKKGVQQAIDLVNKAQKRI